MPRPLVALALLAGLAPAPALAQDLLAIYGAWAPEREECGRVFASEGGRLAFAPGGADPRPGFIVGPDGLTTPAYACAVREYTVRGDTVTFTGRCRAERRTRRVRFAMRMTEGRTAIEVDRAVVPLRRCGPEGLRDMAAVRAERERFEREKATAQEKARGLWAADAGRCERAFAKDAGGAYRVVPGPDGETGVIITPNRIVTRNSVCNAQQAVSDLQTGREFRANYLCQSEGREFATTERVVVMEPDVIERTPAARIPAPQRLVRCAPPGWETALRD